MATSVPVDARTKARLERLRTAVESEMGRPISQQELLARMVAREYEDQESFVDSFSEAAEGHTNGTVGGSPSEEPSTPFVDSVEADDEFEGLSEEETERWLSGTRDWGFETTEAEVDEVLYGSPDEFAEDR